jgi:hypothetical protein
VKDERKAKREDNKIKTWNFLRIFFPFSGRSESCVSGIFHKKKKGNKRREKKRMAKEWP